MLKPCKGPRGVDGPVLSHDDLKTEIEKYKKELFELIDNTRKHKVEYGFTLCWDKENNTTYINEICKGENACVNLMQCRYPYQFATIHVHPKGSGWVPSPTDVKGSIAEAEAVFCVGVVGTTRKKDAFQCYTISNETEARRKFNKALQEDDWMTTSSMIGDSLVHPSKKTIIRPIFRLFRE